MFYTSYFSHAKVRHRRICLRHDLRLQIRRLTTCEQLRGLCKSAKKRTITLRPVRLLPAKGPPKTACLGFFQRSQLTSRQENDSLIHAPSSDEALSSGRWLRLWQGLKGGLTLYRTWRRGQVLRSGCVFALRCSGHTGIVTCISPGFSCFPTVGLQ